jgi:hypothetical protein
VLAEALSPMKRSRDGWQNRGEQGYTPKEQIHRAAYVEINGIWGGSWVKAQDRTAVKACQPAAAWSLIRITAKLPIRCRRISEKLRRRGLVSTQRQDGGYGALINPDSNYMKTARVLNKFSAILHLRARRRLIPVVATLQKVPASFHHAGLRLVR